MPRLPGLPRGVVVLKAERCLYRLPSTLDGHQ